METWLLIKVSKTHTCTCVQVGQQCFLIMLNYMIVQMLNMHMFLDKLVISLAFI